MNKKKEGLFKGASVAELYSKFGVVLILILCLIIGTILSPEFLTGSNLMSVARNVGVYAIIALGMTRLLIGGGVDLSAGSNVAFCSVIVAVIYAQTGSTLMAVIAAILCGMIIGAINGYFASYIGLMPFIVTLATQMTVRGLAYLVAGGAPVYGVSSSIIFLGQGNVGGFPMLLIVVLVTTAIMLFVMTRTSHGRYLYAIGGNRKAAMLSGVKDRLYFFLAYANMGLMSAVAALVYAARLNAATPKAGVNFELDAIAACFVGGASVTGGAGTIGGALVGCFVIGILNNGMSMMGISADWQQTVKGLVILAAVAFDLVPKRKKKSASGSPFAHAPASGACVFFCAGRTKVVAGGLIQYARRALLRWPGEWRIKRGGGATPAAGLLRRRVA